MTSSLYMPTVHAWLMWKVWDGSVVLLSKTLLTCECMVVTSCVACDKGKQKGFQILSTVNVPDIAVKRHGQIVFWDNIGCGWVRPGTKKHGGQCAHLHGPWLINFQMWDKWVNAVECYSDLWNIHLVALLPPHCVRKPSQTQIHNKCCDCTYLWDVQVMQVTERGIWMYTLQLHNMAANACDSTI